MAKNMPRTEEEKTKKTGLFSTDAWKARRRAIHARVDRDQSAAHARAVTRHEIATGTESFISNAKRRAMAVIRQRIETKRRKRFAYNIRKAEQERRENILR